MDNRHYTYDEMKKMIRSTNAMDDCFFEHIAVCEECAEMFVTLSQQIDISPQKTATYNILEQVAIRKERIRNLIYNFRVCFGVFVALVMLFNVPTDVAAVDPVQQNRDQMIYMSEKYEEFEDGFHEFINNAKGLFTNDKTEE